MQFKFLRSRKDLIKFLCSLSEDFEQQPSVKLNRYCVVSKDGGKLVSGNLYGLLKQVNEYLGKDYFSLKDCRPAGHKSFILNINEDFDGSSELNNKIIENKDKKVEKKKEVVDKLEVEVEEKEDGIDWDMINSLEDNPKDKKKLKAYAKELGIELKGNKKLETFIKDLKKALK